MIRFVDLTGDYWSHADHANPICAFLNTTTDWFVPGADGGHTFSSFEEIHRADYNDTCRLDSLVPNGFFESGSPLTADEAEAAIDMLERMALMGVRRSRTRIFQRAEKWVRQAMGILRRRYT